MRHYTSQSVSAVCVCYRHFITPFMWNSTSAGDRFSTARKHTCIHDRSQDTHKQTNMYINARNNKNNGQTVCTLHIKHPHATFKHDRTVDVIYSSHLLRMHQKVRMIWAKDINRWRSALDIWLTECHCCRLQ